MIYESKDEDLKREVLKASIKMLRTNDIYGYVMLRIPILITDKYNKESDTVAKATAWTNGKMLVINSGNKKGVQEVFNAFGAEKILKHELSHILLNHISRQNEFIKVRNVNPEILYITTDYVINKEIGLSGNGCIDADVMRKGFGLKDEDMKKIDKMSFEQIIYYLKDKFKDNKQKGKGKGGEKGEDGDPAESMEWGLNPQGHIIAINDEAVNKMIEEEMKAEGITDQKEYINDIIRKAITKQYGKERTGFWKELEDMLFNSKLNWRKIMRDYIKAYKSHEDADDGHKYVHRRYHQLSQYMPSLPIMFNHKKNIYDKVIIAVDTSGSISDEQYKQQVAEILGMLKVEKIKGELLLFTTDIEKKLAFDDKTNISETLKFLKNRTQGGTSFIPIYEYAEKQRARLLITFSDLYASYPEKTKYAFKSLFITENKDNEEAKKLGNVIVLN